MATEVGTSALNYTEVKQKALSSKLIRTIKPSSNGVDFVCGNTINFETESNAMGMYLDVAASYMKFEIHNTSAAAITLDQSAYALINRLMITTAGQTICDLQHYNVLMNALMSSGVGQSYLSFGVGRELLGTSGVVNGFQGKAIAGGQSLAVSLPLQLSPLSMTQPHRYIYCGARSPFQYKITLESGNIAFFSASSVVDSEVQIKNFEVVMNYVQLNSEAQSQVNAMIGGKYNVLCSEFVNFQTTLAANVTALSFPLGVARSSMDRLIVLHRNQANATAFNKYSLSARDTADIRSSQLLVSGQSIPQRRIESNTTTAGKYAPFMAEFLVANHDLNSMDHTAILYNNGATTDSYELDGGAGNTASTIGSFVYAIECESLAYNSERAFSGVNTIGQSVFLNNTYGGVARTYIVDCFAQNTILLSLDMNGSGVYSVSV